MAENLLLLHVDFLRTGLGLQADVRLGSCPREPARLPRSNLSLISRKRHETSSSSWTRCSKFMTLDHRIAFKASPSWAATTADGRTC